MLRFRQALLLGAAAVLLALSPSGLLADGGGGGGGGGDGSVFTPQRHPNYVKAQRLIDTERYAEAVPLLEALVSEEPDNADAYNLLGYSVRKMGRPRDALAWYEKALRINPEHRGAHEYMGEAYLQLNQPDEARKHLAFLDDDCWLPCEEYSDLKEAIARYEAGRR